MALVVLAMIATGSLPGSPSTRPASAATVGLQIDDGHLTRDGDPFLPRGFNMVGLLAPAWCTSGQGPAAAAHFGQAELDAAKGWNANTLRFQVSQRGLADTSRTQAERDAYLQRVVDGVDLARSNGFAVVVSMQDQSNGCGPAHPLPSSQTVAAWQVLAPALMADPYIMFELFNEPNVSNTTAGWQQWHDGGTGPTTNQGDTPVGHQALVDLLRGMGVQNVLIADGPNKAERFAGLIPLTDPAGQLMYGLHPYNMSTGQAWWDQQFGSLTDSAPLIATEWNFAASGCTGANVALAQQLLPYLQQHDIGLLAHAFDVPGTTITDDWAWTPTECGTAQGGSGRMTKDFFAGQTDGPLPLGAPTGLQGHAPAPDTVQLSWQAATGPVDTYDVLRDGVVVASVEDPAYTDTSVSADQTYTYAVRAVDDEGTTGPLSDEVQVTTPDVADSAPPTAPDSLSATAMGPQQVDLTWDPATDDTGVVGYHVLRDGTPIATTTTPGWSDTTAEQNTTYSYTVTAEDAAGNLSGPVRPGISDHAPRTRRGRSLGAGQPRGHDTVGQPGHPQLGPRVTTTSASTTTSCNAGPRSSPRPRPASRTGR